MKLFQPTVFFSVLLLFIFSCNKKQRPVSERDSFIEPKDHINEKSADTLKTVYLSPFEYVDFFRSSKNGLTVKRKSSNVLAEVSFYTPSYKTLLELGPKCSEREFKSLLTEFESLQYFDLELSTDNKDVDFNEEYFAFDMQNDIKLIDGKDTLKCILFHQEKSYGLSPKSHFLLGFDAENRKSSDKLVLFTPSQSIIDTLKFPFASKNIINIPQLIFNKK